MRKLSILSMLLVLSITTTFGQDVVVPADADFFNAPSYVIVVISGVLLAFGFQFLLTVLSVAAGITTIGNLKEAYVESKYSDLGTDDEDDDDDRLEKETPMGVKVTTGLGIWNVLTLAISLFGATYLALKLIPITTDMTKVSLALVIWSAFFMLVFYLEGKMIGTIVGGLVSTAIAGLKASGSVVSSIFTPTPASQVKSITNDAIEKMRKEFSAEFDTESVVNSIKKYVNKQAEKAPDYKTLKSDLEEIAVKAAKAGKGGKSNASRWMAIQSIINMGIQAAANTDTEEGQKKADDLKQLLADVKEAYDKGDNLQESFKNVVKLTPADEEKVDAQIDDIKRKLQTSDDSSMNVEQLQKMFDDFKNNPQEQIQHAIEKVKTWDRATVIDMLNENTALDKRQLNNYADRIQNAIHTASERFGITNEDPYIDNMMTSFESNVRNYVNHMNAPGIRYDLLKNDLKRAINDPSQSMAIVSNRLKTFDKNTMTAVLTSTPWINRSDIENLATTVEEARNEVSTQLEKVNSKVTSTINNAERKAVIQAEHLRQTAAAAAWWLVAAIIISAGAAIAGGMLSV